MKYSIAVCILLNAAIDVSGALFGGSNEVSKGIDACSSQPPNCRIQCLGEQLKFSDDKGNIQLEKAPLYDLIKKNIPNVANKCKSSGNDKCARFTNRAKCLTKEGEKMIGTKGRQCAAETKTTGLKYDPVELGQSIQEPSRFCYFRCMGKKIGFIDGADNVNTKLLLKNLKVVEPGELEKLSNECSSSNTQSNPCEKVTKRVMCLGMKLFTSYGALNALKAKNFLNGVF